MSALRNLRVVTPEGVRENARLVVENGRIAAIEPDSGPFSGSTVLPGFLDAHIHGGGGADTMDATPDALRTLTRLHLRHGTTGLLATTMTQSRAKITAALANVAAAVAEEAAFCPDGAHLLGIHLEGPYISPGKPGAQPKEFVRDYDADEFAGWLTAAQGQLRQITLAPERPGADALLATCRKNKIVVSLGHTDADAAQTRDAIKAGARQATHLFNAMNGVHHRKPGPIPVFLTDRRARVEVIADGFHLAPEVVAMVYAAVGPTRFIAITDAMAGAGNGDGNYDLGGHAVTVRDGKATLADGTIAGSVLTMIQAARNLRDWCDLGWSQLARVTATNLALQQGWQHKGRLQVGCDADFVLVDDELNLDAVYVGGQQRA